MKAIMVIRDPEAFQLLADETRRKIIYLLRVNEMTVSQMASDLNVTPQAIYHHIKKLQDAKMIEVTREERLGHLIESYYRATAETFMLSHGKVDYQTFRNKERGKQQMATILNALKKLGFNLEYDDKKISLLVDLQGKLEQCCADADKLEDKVFEMTDLDWITQSKIKEYIDTLTMTDEEFAKQWETKKKLRDTLKKSLVKK